MVAAGCTPAAFVCAPKRSNSSRFAPGPAHTPGRSRTRSAGGAKPGGQHGTSWHNAVAPLTPDTRHVAPCLVTNQPNSLRAKRYPSALTNANTLTMLPAGMGLVAVFGALALGAVRSLMAEPNVLTRHAFGSPGTGVGSGVSATSCVGVGLLTGGDGALGVLVGATVGCGV